MSSLPYRPKIYTASKIRHAAMWRSARSHYPQLEFTARWIEVAEGVPDHSESTTFWNEEQQMLHWIQDVQDVQRSDWVLAYKEPLDELHGTQFECGAAVGLGKMVVEVGMSSRQSWTAHPLVVSLDSLADAFAFILSGAMHK